MEPFRVFVSSIMNRRTEDLLQEREAARNAVEQFSPITDCWAFEAEPASSKPLLDFYLQAVQTSDLLVLILGQHVTAPVKAEYETARDHGKPVLAFCKQVPARDAEADQLLRSLNVKYEPFANAVELREKLRRALGMELLHRIRGDGQNAEGHGERVAHLRRFAREGTVVWISPLIPPTWPGTDLGHYHSFRVVEAQSEFAVFGKRSASDQQVRIPTPRVTEVLLQGGNEPPQLRLNGRLQLLTLKGEWNFFPEPPTEGDGLRLGVAKEVDRSAPEVMSVCESMQAIGKTAVWSTWDRIAARLGANTHEVFYDDEGYYLRQRRRDTDSVLMIARPNVGLDRS